MPPKTAYKNDLTGEECCEKDYMGAKDIFRKFKLENLGALHNLYVGCDTHLLGTSLLIFFTSTRVNPVIFNHFLTLSYH